MTDWSDTKRLEIIACIANEMLGRILPPQEQIKYAELILTLAICTDELLENNREKFAGYLEEMNI